MKAANCYMLEKSMFFWNNSIYFDKGTSAVVIFHKNCLKSVNLSVLWRLKEEFYSKVDTRSIYVEKNRPLVGSLQLFRPSVLS